MSTLNTGHRKQSTPVNWPEVHRRLEDAWKKTEHGWTPTPEERQRILKERARVLAQEPPREEAEDVLEVVEFLLAYETYAIESSFVREVYPLKELTPLPGTPPFVLGIINVRGHILSVLDIKKFFDLPEKGLTDLNKVIILHHEAMEFGILADSIVGMKTIPIKALQPALPTLTGIREQYLRGITPERIIVLHAEKLLSDNNIVVNEEIRAS